MNGVLSHLMEFNSRIFLLGWEWYHLSQKQAVLNRGTEYSTRRGSKLLDGFPL
jgi:hypothetical protein